MGNEVGGISTRATLDDLLAEEGKAELLGGEIVRFMASGHGPGQVASEIFVSLRAYARARGVGVAHADGVGFAVPELASGRESFSPDASYYVGPLPKPKSKFLPGPPTFAVEVRSESDSGPAAERAMAAKRADYFEAGTLVVWDVDPDAESVHCYRRDTPDAQITFAPGDRADAEPAVPGWRVDPAEFFG